jgi:hypothetical protein
LNKYGYFINHKKPYFNAKALEKIAVGFVDEAGDDEHWSCDHALGVRGCSGGGCVMTNGSVGDSMTTVGESMMTG